MKYLFNLLGFLNLLEARTQRLSLSNLLIYVCLFKIALTQSVGFPDLAGLLLALLNYSHRRYVSNAAAQINEGRVLEKAKSDAEKQLQLEQINATLNHNLSNQVSELTKAVNVYQELAKETQHIINNHKISQMNRKF